jgi:hypothetical protein
MWMEKRDSSFVENYPTPVPTTNGSVHHASPSPFTIFRLSLPCLQIVCNISKIPGSSEVFRRESDTRNGCGTQFFLFMF